MSEVREREFNITRPSGQSYNHEDSKSILSNLLRVINLGEVLSGSVTYRSDLQFEGPVVVYIHGTLSSGNHNFTTDLANKLCKG